MAVAVLAAVAVGTEAQQWQQEQDWLVAVAVLVAVAADIEDQQGQ